MISKVKFYNTESLGEKENAIKILENALYEMDKSNIYVDADLLVNHGNLIRNYLKKYDSNKYLESHKKYKRFFDKGIKSYLKAQEQPKKFTTNKGHNDMLHDNDVNGSYNDYAFLGEVFMYSNELNILSDLKKEKKNNNIDTFLPKYEVRIIKIIDLFERYIEEGKIYLSDSGDNNNDLDTPFNTRLERIKKQMGNILINLLEMKSAVSINISNFNMEPGLEETDKFKERYLKVEKLIKNLSNSQLEYNILIMLKSIKSSVKINNWEDLKTEELKIVADYLKEMIEIKDKPFHSTFHNLIYAMIYYAQNISNIGSEYNISVALGYCNVWRKNYPQSFNAYFFNGVFQLVYD